MARLRSERFDYFGGISLLGLVGAIFTSAGIALPAKLSGAPPLLPPRRAEGRPIAPEILALSAGEAVSCSPRLYGHLDDVRGARRIGDGHWRADAATLTLVGWVFAPDLEGAQSAVEVVSAERVVALGLADRPRRDLAGRGHGDGRYGFAIDLPVADLLELAQDGSRVGLRLRVFDGRFVPVGGDIVVDL